MILVTEVSITLHLILLFADMGKKFDNKMLPIFNCFICKYWRYESLGNMAIVAYNKWATSCEKGPDDMFCPFLVLGVFAHFLLQIT